MYYMLLTKYQFESHDTEHAGSEEGAHHDAHHHSPAHHSRSLTSIGRGTPGLRQLELYIMDLVV